MFFRSPDCHYPQLHGIYPCRSLPLKTTPNQNLFRSYAKTIMKKYLLSLLALIASNYLLAQAPERPFCYTDEMYREAVRQNPAVLQEQQALENFTQQFVNRSQTERYMPQLSNGSRTATYIIPVVFHILHEYGPENISDAQVLDCLMHMNQDFRKLNGDTVNTIPVFKPLAADCDIEFRLATIDPSGNCTNGIDRIYTSKTNSANDQSKLNPWPRNQYLNIWVAKTLENTGAAAYAYLPGTAPSSGVDGIISRYDYIGTIGAGGSGGLHTISHETGHHFNLQHTWGSTNSPGVACGDDGVSDTPITQGYTSCNLTGSICNPPIIENVQNFMEYSYCDNMFTIGQRDRMHAALNAATASRNNLWTQANLIATGTLNPPTAQCAPTADFWATPQTICTGRSVTFQDFSWKGQPTSWSWNFPGGIPATSTDSAPTVTYNAAGIYDVTMTATNATGSNTLTRTGFIRVSNTVGIVAPILEPFATAAAITANDAWIYNPDNGTTWNYLGTTGAAGTVGCMRINNYSNTAGQTDEWISPPYDISNLSSVSLKFYVANAQRSSTSADELRVFTSSNCGETWTPKYSKSGATLATAGVIATNFTPNSTQWRQETISLNGIFPRTNIRFKFQNNSDRGNNTYIDEIQITGTPNNVDEVDDITTGFGLYPNPSTGSATIQFKLNSAKRVQIFVHDITGRMVAQLMDETLSADMHEVPVKLDTKGIYLIDVIAGEKHHVRRLTIAN